MHENTKYMFFHKTRKLVFTIVKDFTTYLRIPSKPQKSVPTNLNFFTIYEKNMAQNFGGQCHFKVTLGR
jgi:hypothetical protein